MVKNVLRLGSIALTTVLFLFASVPVLAQRYDYDWDWATYTTATDAGLFGLSGIALFVFWCCMICGLVIVPFVLAFIVYSDAKKKNVENPALWAVLTFFFNLIGLIIYFFVIRPEAIKKASGDSTNKKE